MVKLHMHTWVSTGFMKGNKILLNTFLRKKENSKKINQKSNVPQYFCFVFQSKCLKIHQDIFTQINLVFEQKIKCKRV